MVVGSHNLVGGLDRHSGLTDVREVVTSNDLHIWNTGMGHQTSPRVETCTCLPFFPLRSLQSLNLRDGYERGIDNDHCASNKLCSNCEVNFIHMDSCSKAWFLSYPGPIIVYACHSLTHSQTC